MSSSAPRADTGAGQAPGGEARGDAVRQAGSAVGERPGGRTGGGAESHAGRLRLPRDPRVRALLVLGAIVVGFGVLGAVWEALSPEPAGPRSSSYATAPAGAAGFAELLERRGRQVLRRREEPRERPLPARTTLVALDPGSLAGDDRRAIARFVRAGGRLVVAGRGSEGIASELLDRPPSLEAEGPEDGAPVAPVPEAAGAIRTNGEAQWADSGEALPVIAGDGGALVLTARAGRGTLVLLATASPLQNRLLARADNAAVALALAPRDRPVTFLESVHGYGRATGLAALPERWKWMLAGLALATLVFVLARVRRFGPPEEAVRALPPPRRLYVESVGRTLARTKDPRTAAEPVRDEGRRLVVRRAGLPAQAGDPEVREAAERLGLDPEEARVVAEGPATRADVMAAGRALARLRKGVG